MRLPATDPARTTEEHTDVSISSRAVPAAEDPAGKVRTLASCTTLYSRYEHMDRRVSPGAVPQNATWSPTFTRETPGPISTTVPDHSWPGQPGSSG